MLCDSNCFAYRKVENFNKKPIKTTFLIKKKKKNKLDIVFIYIKFNASEFFQPLKMLNLKYLSLNILLNDAAW